MDKQYLEYLDDLEADIRDLYACFLLFYLAYALEDNFPSFSDESIREFALCTQLSYIEQHLCDLSLHWSLLSEKYLRRPLQNGAGGSELSE